MRVIASVYTGSTEKRALDELVGLGAKVKVSYETSQTRLHAKAWLFERNSGYPHRLRWVVQPHAFGPARRARMECSRDGGRQPSDHRAHSGDVRAVLERARVRDVRPARRRRPATGGTRCREPPWRAPDALSAEHSCRAEAVPGGDARGARAPSGSAGTSATSSSHRPARQDVGLRVRLPAAPQGGPRTAAVRGPSQRDPRAEPGGLPIGA